MSPAERGPQHRPRLHYATDSGSRPARLARLAEKDGVSSLRLHACISHDDPQQLALQLSVRFRSGFGADIDDVVVLVREHRPIPAKDLAHDPLAAVPLDRSSVFPRDRQAQPRSPEGVGKNEDGVRGAHQPSTAPVDPLEIGCAQNAVGRTKGLAGHGRTSVVSRKSCYVRRDPVSGQRKRRRLTSRSGSGRALEAVRTRAPPRREQHFRDTPLHSNTLAALCAPAPDDVASSRRAHADEEAVSALPATIVRLKRSLHDFGYSKVKQGKGLSYSGASPRVKRLPRNLIYSLLLSSLPSTPLDGSLAGSEVLDSEELGASEGNTK